MIVIKKIVSILTALVLLIMIMGAVTASAAVEYNVELIRNGGFETLSSDGTTAAEWNRFGTWSNGSVLSIAKASDNAGNVHSGSYAVKYVTKAGDNPYLVQYSVPAMGRFKYKLSFWYKGTTTGNGFSVKFEQYGPGVAAEQYSDSYTTSSVWKQATYEFYAADGVTGFSVMPRTYTEGTEVYIDDISLTCIEGPDMLDMETDWVFYYEDYDEATITLTMDEVYDDTGYTADLKIVRGLQTPLNVKDLTFTDNKLIYKADITKLSKNLEYTLQATIRDSDGTAVETLKQQIYRYNRPTNMTKDGIYMVDGEPFEPVIAYHFDINDYEDAKKAGINVIQWAPSNGTNKEVTLAELDAIHAKGLKASVVCYWGMNPAGHSSNQTRIQQFVTDIKDHPAVFCYMVMDEPFSHTNDNDEMEDMLRLSYKIIRSVDDAHPVYLCEDQKAMYPTSAKYVDCLGIDPYPGTGDFGRHVANMTQAAREGTKYEKPVYTVVQAMSWKGITPTPEMLRTQLYQAMMGGAQAYGYYPWIPDDATLDTDLNEGRYWDTMLSFYEKDHSLLFEYYGRGEHETFNKYRDDDLWYESFVKGDDIYTVVLNRTSEDKTATVSLGSANGKIVLDNYTMSVINGGDMAAVTKNSGSFTVNMSGYQAVLYKITPAVTPDYDLMEDIAVNGSFENLTDGTLDGWSFFNTSQAEVLKTTGGTDGDGFVEITIDKAAEGETQITQKRLDATFTGVPGVTYVLEFDYKTTTDNVALVNADAAPSWRQVGKWLPSTDGQWKRERVIVPLTDTDSGVMVIRLRNMGVGATVSYDNITLVPLKAENKILLLNEAGAEITEASGVSGKVTAYAEGLANGDRLYLAVYEEKDGAERLCDIKVTTAKGEDMISLAFEDVSGSKTAVKAFVWSKTLGTKLIKTLN